MNILSVDPVTDPQWQRLLAKRTASVFHSPPWAGVLLDAYGLSIQAYVATDLAGEPVAGVPFCNVSDSVGSRIISLPFSDYCDPLVTTREEWEVLFRELEVYDLPMIFRCLHSEISAADNRLVTVKRARWHGLDLDTDLEGIWRNLADPTRRAIRKAQREGVVVQTLDDETFLKEFYQLHLGVRKYKYRLLPQPYTFFEAIRDRFRDVDGWFPLAACHQGRVIAATIFLRWDDTLYYKFNASHFEALPLRPNDLLLWEGITLGKTLGCRRLDLGLSDEDQPGLIRFKRYFGTQEKEIRFLRHSPDGSPGDRETEMRALLGELTDLFTDPSVPDDVTRRAGTLLYRLFA